MKKLMFIVSICSLLLSQQTIAQELKSEFLIDLEINFDRPQAVGPVLQGIRLISPIKDGLVKGSKLNGKILDGGDWGLVVDSTTFKVDSRATLQMEDGTVIYITYSGYSHASAKVAAMIGAGKGGELSPSDYYFRTNVTFETSSPKYSWLNHIAAIGVGRFPAPSQVSLRVYAIK
jgi:hypothetical protein